MISFRALAAVFALALGACGGASGGGATVAGPESGASAQTSAHGPKAASRLGEVADAKVFDTHGASSVCAPPRAEDACPAVAIDRSFLDRCKLGGFELRRCGCDTLCAGDVSASSRYFDATGKASECVATTPDCAAPPASAALQDACTDRGHKLAVCGCEWLCSGDPTK